MATWDDVTKAEGFSDLSDTDKAQAANYFFDQAIAPKVDKADLDSARQYFLQKAGFAQKPEDSRFLDKAKHEASRIGRAAINDSLSGTVYLAATGDYAAKQPKDMGFWENAAAQILSFADPASIFTFGVGGKVGGAALKAALSAGKKELGAKLAAQAAGEKVAFTTGEKAAIQSAQSAGALGAFQPAMNAADQKATTGKIDLTEVAKAAGKGVLLGAASGAVGGSILANKAATATGKVAQHATDIAAQSAVFTGGGAALDGKMPTTEDYAANLAMFGGLKGSHYLLGKLAPTQDLTVEPDTEEEGTLYPEDPQQAQVNEADKVTPKVPESYPDLAAQVQAVKEGRKPAMFVPDGSEIPFEAADLERIKVDGGVLISTEKAKGGSKRGKIKGIPIRNEDGSLNGQLLGYSSPVKPVDGLEVTTVGYDANGDVVHEEVGDSPEAHDAALIVAGEGGRVEVLPTDQALQQRQQRHEADLASLNEPNLGARSRDDFLIRQQRVQLMQEREAEARQQEAQRLKELVVKHEEAVNAGYQPTEQETAEYEDAKAQLGVMTTQTQHALGAPAAEGEVIPPVDVPKGQHALPQPDMSGIFAVRPDGSAFELTKIEAEKIAAHNKSVTTASDQVMVSPDGNSYVLNQGQADFLDQYRAETQPVEEKPITIHRRMDTSQEVNEPPAQDTSPKKPTQEDDGAKTQQKSSAENSAQDEKSKRPMQGATDENLQKFVDMGNHAAIDEMKLRAAENVAAKKKPTVSKNTIFTESKAEEARRILRESLTQMNAGLDPKVAQAGITLAGYHIESGARTFAAYSKAMVNDLGDMIKPYLKQFYMSLKFDPQAVDLAKDMDSATDVEAADIESILTSDDTHDINAATGEDYGRQKESTTTNDAGRTDDESGISATEPRPHDGRGSKNRAPRIQEGQAGHGKGHSSKGKSDGLSSDGQVVGHKTNGSSVKNDGSQAGTDGVLSGTSRSNSLRNYDLRTKPPIQLTPAKRRDANNIAVAVLQKPIDQITESDKDALRLYTGNGGLSNKDSADKGAGIFNQHYTNYETVRAMYRALQEAGLKFQRALEPSVGSGNFIGMNPDLQWTAVDIDATNTEVVKRLYPKAKVHNESYETFTGNNFDLIISNVPFASFSSLPRANAQTVKPAFKAIHNFFFAQSIDKLKDGGVMAFMTSTGTMDGTTEAMRLRKYLVDHADLIGAYRLPMGSQKANASTEVMIDIIFMQKRPEGIASNQPEKNALFTQVTTIHGHRINKYFAENQDAILGDLSVGKDKTRMGKEGLIVTGEPIYSRIKVEPQVYIGKLVDDNPDNSFATVTDAKAYADEHGLIFKKGQHRRSFKDGILYDTPVTFSEETTRGIFGHKDLSENAAKMNLLQQIEQSMNPNLVTDYEDKYTKPPHSDRKLKKWAKDNNAIRAYNSYLSMFDKEFNLGEGFTAQVKFKNSGKIEDVDRHSPLPMRAEASEDQDGFIDHGELISRDEFPQLLNQGLYAQVKDGVIQNARLYYAGNIYKKLDSLNGVSNRRQREWQRARLEQRKPALIPISRITIKGNESWLPDVAVSALGKRRDYEGNEIIGEDAISEPDYLHMYNRYLRGETLIKKNKDATDEEHNSTLAEAQETLTSVILPSIKEHLMNLGLESDVVEAYNRKRNFFAPPVFDGSSLRNLPKRFRGKAFNLMKHQQEGVERAIYNKKGVIAFAPGLGKTPTAIVVINQLLQKGVVKKPLFIVPANTIPQWEDTALQLYPDSKVFQFPRYTRGVNKGKVKAWANMTPSDKEKMINDLKNSRFDYTFISSELARSFVVPRSKMQEYVNDLISQIHDVEDADTSTMTKYQLKRHEATLAQIEMLRTFMMRDYDSTAEAGFNMEDLGFDAIVADEVQYYKNVGVVSKDARGGIGAGITIKTEYHKDDVNKEYDPKSVKLQSARSYDFRFKTRYISEMNNGNNVFLLTGTPTPNKPLELLTLLHHLDIGLLEEYGVNSAQEFSNEFLEIEEIATLNLAGKEKMKPILTGMKNIDALEAIKSRYIDYRSPESARDLVRPRQIDITHTILKTPEEDRIFEDIQGRILKSIEDMILERQGDTGANPERIIQLYGAGRDASIDPRLYKASEKSRTVSIDEVFKANDDPRYNKIAATVRLVSDNLMANPEGGQLIFLDRLKFVNGGSTHEDIRDRIIAESGLDPKQVVFVNGQRHVNPNTGKVVKSAPKPERLQQIIDAYNAGDVKVVIGNTAKLGVGVDLQVTTTDIYQVDKPYRPDEIEQRNNRGVRQGNRNKEVRVHSFTKPGTFDEMSDRIISSKQGFNDVYWKHQDGATADVSPESPPSAYDAAIELETDPVRRRKLEIERDLSNAAMKTVGYTKQINKLKMTIRSAENTKLAYENGLERLANPTIPKYEGLDGKELAAKIAAFRQRVQDKIEKDSKRLESINERIEKMTQDLAVRETELADHTAYIQSITDKYVRNGAVDMDVLRHVDKFSKSSTQTTGLTEAQSKQSLIKQFGAGMKRAIAKGKVVIHRTDAGVPSGISEENVVRDGERVQGWYENGVTHIVASNNDESNIAATTLHEVGHAFFDTEKGARVKARAIKQIELARRAKGGKIAAWMREAEAAIPADTKESDRAEEFLAYAITQHQQKIQQPLGIHNIVQRFLDALGGFVRAHLIKLGMPLKVTPATLHQLAKDHIGALGKREVGFSGMLEVAMSMAKEYGITVEEAQRQYDEVVAKYKGTDQWMKAPNGKATNLNERQWVQVRTPAFKAWFGDWEKDPKNASKVIDENGEPRVVYKGMLKRNWRNGNEIFTIDSPNGPWAGFFSSSPTVAKRFSDVFATMGEATVVEAFINIKNPLTQDAKGARAKDFMFDDTVFGKDPTNPDGRDAFSNGYDAVIVKNTDDEANVFIPRDSNQIKSATGNTGQFDSSTGDIRYSKAAFKKDVQETTKDLKKSHGDLYRAGHRFLRSMYFRPVQIVRNLGAPASKMIADLVYKDESHENRVVNGDDMVQRQQQMQGHFFTILEKITEGLPRKLRSKAGQAMIVDALNGDKVAMSAIRAAKPLRNLMEEMKTYLQNAGVIGEGIERYFPRVYDQSKMRKNKDAFIALLDSKGYNGEQVWMNIVDNDGIYQNWSDHHFEVGDDGELVKIKRKGKSSNTRHHSFEKGRVLDIPYADLKPFLVREISPVISRHIRASTMRAEYANTFGNESQVLDKLIEQFKHEYDKVPHGNKVLSMQEALDSIYYLTDRMQGKRESMGVGADRIARIAKNASIMIHLPLVLLASIPETLTPATRLGSYRFAKHILRAIPEAAMEGTASVFKMVTGVRPWGKSELRQLTDSLGVTTMAGMEMAYQTRFGGISSKMTDGFMRATLLEQMTNLQRMVSFSMAVDHINSLYKKQKTKQVELELKDFSLDPNGADKSEILMAAQRFAQQVITTPNGATLPSIMSHPIGSIAFQFKSFTSVFSNTILKKVLLDFKRNPSLAAKLRPIVPMLGMIGVAFAVQFLREWIKYDDKKEAYRKQQDYWKRLMDAVDRSGLTGDFTALYNFFNPYRYGFGDAGRRLFNFAGPLVGDTARAINVAAEYKHGKIKAAAKNITRFVPVVNSVAPLRQGIRGAIERGLR